jgi:hypothetical protein
MKKRLQKKKLKQEINYLIKFGAHNWLSRRLRAHLEYLYIEKRI